MPPRILIAFLVLIATPLLAAPNQEVVREQRSFTINGVKEVWRLLWLPPGMQEVLIECAYDRVRSSVRPSFAAFSEAAGRDGDQRIGPNLISELYRSQAVAGFPNPDLFDHCAHSGRRLLTPPSPDVR